MKVFEVLRSQEICITNLEAIQCGVTYAFGLGPQERIVHILCRNGFEVLRGSKNSRKDAARYPRRPQ